MSMNGVTNTQNAASSVSPAAVEIIRDAILEQAAKQSVATTHTTEPKSTQSIVQAVPLPQVDLGRYLHLHVYRKQRASREQKQNTQLMLFGIVGFVSGLFLWSALKHGSHRTDRSGNSTSTGVNGVQRAGASRRKFKRSLRRSRS
jgi:hypothetical protein